MPSSHRVAIALGSNLGDRFHNIELALRLLEEPDYILSSPNAQNASAFLDVVDTSFMYETAPMYVTEQPAFINCACIAETNLEPVQLLELLKRVEQDVGRVPSMRYGPRAVDLDIVFFDQAVIDTRPLEGRQRLDNLVGELVVPHPRLTEREFVLRPLSDMIPEYQHPVLKKTVKDLLSGVTAVADVLPMQKVIPFPRHPIHTTSIDDQLPSYPTSVSQVPPTLTYWTHPCHASRHVSQTSSPIPSKHKTHVMAIINVTPDSFSDGSRYDTVPTALAHASESVVTGATILDVGGYSTRPDAGFVTVEEEIARVRPVIDAVRRAGVEGSGFNELLEYNKILERGCKLNDVLVSVDTFRSEVAEAAILSGANCINDVYSFTGPEWWKGSDASEETSKEKDSYMQKMKEVARKYNVPIVLMHSRGDAGKNKDYGMYGYAEEAVVEGVRVELGEKVERIVRGKGGVRRWLVIVDVGLGFSKTVEGNLELLRSAAKVTADVAIGPEPTRRRNPLAGYPQLIGPSRKSFLGALLAQGQHGRQTQPKERSWATAAAVACAIQQGALVVRIHDVQEMVDVVRISDAIW
ncbi:hypothetical protein AX17_007000 [Amanita inopinata Kibby_2008]|nr:hypothetical protein AX17_007000 [Amanita inopinata Kibby_2008]